MPGGQNCEAAATAAAAAAAAGLAGYHAQSAVDFASNYSPVYAGQYLH